jgi:hypothetical protein
VTTNESDSGLQLLTEAGIGKLAEIQVTKDDIVTIAVARREQDLISQREELEESLSQLRTRREELGTALEESIEAQVEATRPTYIQAIEALQECGFKVKLELNYHWETLKSGPRVYVTTTLQSKKQDDHRGGQLTACHTLKMGATGLQLMKEIADLEAEIAQSEKTLLAVRRELGQLTTMERQAKAQVALQLLSNSKQGQQILAMMDRAPKLLTAKK